MPLARRPLSGYAWKTTLFSPSLPPSLPPFPRPDYGNAGSPREVPAKERKKGTRGDATTRGAREQKYLSPPPPLPEPFNGICIVCKLAVFMARMPRARTSVHWLLFSFRQGGKGEGESRDFASGGGRAHKNNSIPPKRQCRRLSEGQKGQRGEGKRRQGEREIEE